MILLTILGGAVALFGVIVIASIWRGWVLSVLWGWFVVPLFGLPELSLWWAVALSLTVGFVTAQYPPPTPKGQKPDTSDAIARALIYLAVGPALTLGFGWLVHQWAT